ncbi:NAD(P)H-binding protein [Lactiplantibacillus paraplantarum]|uniref:NAD(P)H-binding protein n=1 Tax=Lactiplantibacillus paraplantarum TaxID=60520 RepID=UPI0023AB2A24|nr:NAD(P)H-binding protein [Lactiplantibacillus paraplantarum]WEE35624.1 NAD(P)H-binding protein [Lactiplantibacillus paraplantarum]
MNILVLGANGQIARLVEEQLLKSADRFNLKLYLRNKARLNEYADNAHVELIEGDINNVQALKDAMKNIDLVFVATVDNKNGNTLTKGVISAMKQAGVKRVLAANSIGIYNEEPNQKFADWNQDMLRPYIPAMRTSDELYQASGLDYTTLRFAWLNDHDEINYSVTNRGEKFAGGSGSRKSMADLVVKIVNNPDLYLDKTIGISDPETKNNGSVVY